MELADVPTPLLYFGFLTASLAFAVATVRAGRFKLIQPLLTVFSSVSGVDKNQVNLSVSHITRDTSLILSCNT